MRTALFIMSMLILFLAFCLTGYIGYYSLWPFKTIEIKKQPIVVLTKEVMAGQQMEYELEYCRYTDKHAHTTRQFIDGVIYTMPEIMTTADTGCHTKRYALTVPETLSGGTYHLRLIMDIEINKFRSIQTTFVTEDFRVISKQEQHEVEDKEKFEKLLKTPTTKK